MITGAHLLLFSKDADADRAFIRDVLEFRSIDLGHNWLIFGLPPSEMAVHPTEAKSEKSNAQQKLLRGELYLMCDDLTATMRSLEAKRVTCGPVKKERWGIVTTVRLPSGGEIGLYQPKHETMIGK